MTDATPLPSRERVAELSCTARSPEEAADIEAILEAFRVGDLKTAAEWREAIDYEAGLAVARELWTVEPVWDEPSLDLVFAAVLGVSDHE